VAGSGDHDRCINGVGVHAGLVVMVHGNESPVCNDTSNAEVSVGILACDEVFDGGGIEEFDVGETEDFGEEGGGEECLGWVSVV